jgi:hypothetical protein
MAADRLTLDVDGQTVEFTDPGKARAAARRWQRMARELDGSKNPDVTLKQHELRARAKAAQDWARAAEDQEIRRNPPSGRPDEPSGGGRKTAAPTAAPAGERSQSPSGARRQAAAALAASGVRRTRRGASGGRRAARTARRRYEGAGGAQVATGAGEFAIFFFGGIVLLTLLEDLLTKRGSAGFAGATKTTAAIAHKVIAPVPIVSKGGS